MEDFLKQVRLFVYTEIERTGVPARPQVDFTTETAKNLARTLGADVTIVEIGTLLMDAMMGQALIENRPKDHIQMALDKTNELLSQSTLSDVEKDNIRHCVSEHHGLNKFYSIESEVCCNADCYKFASVKGFTISLRYTRDMSLPELIQLLKEKVEEKWNAISLDIVKKDLTPQYQTLTKLLENLS